MRFPTPLVRGTLIKRYKRFLADIELENGSSITVTCPNTGSLMGLCQPGVTVWLSESESPTRKYRHTWELVELGKGRSATLVSINTGLPNKIVAEAIEAGAIAELTGYATLKREVKYGQSSRIDILLEDPKKGLAYVEVKITHLVRTPGVAEFPDGVTARGVKHLEEMTAMVREGHRAAMVYLVTRKDAATWSPAGDIDPAYAKAFVAARKAGVEAYAWRSRVTRQEIVAETPIQIKI
jgi:sugar fermentation stimulation protein A